MQFAHLRWVITKTPATNSLTRTVAIECGDPDCRGGPEPRQVSRDPLYRQSGFEFAAKTQSPVCMRQIPTVSVVGFVEILAGAAGRTDVQVGIASPIRLRLAPFRHPRSGPVTRQLTALPVNDSVSPSPLNAPLNVVSVAVNVTMIDPISDSLSWLPGAQVPSNEPTEILASPLH